MKQIIKAVVTLVLTLCIPLAAMAVPAEWPKKLTLRAYSHRIGSRNHRSL